MLWAYFALSGYVPPTPTMVHYDYGLKVFVSYFDGRVVQVIFFLSIG